VNALVRRPPAGAPEGPPQWATMLPLVAREYRKRAIPMACAFAVIALAALVIGLLLPARYTSSTTILVEETNIIGPLMEGRAVPTGVANRARLTREVAFSRRVMNEILAAGEWEVDRLTPVGREMLLDEIRGRTQITHPRENLIQIAYTDTEPRRAFQVTRRFGELVIDESLAAKERESREAYEFIDEQVRQYHAKLTGAEAALNEYRERNPDARPGADSDVSARIGELRRLAEGTRLELMDLRSQQHSLRSQLSGESRVQVRQTRATQLMTRLAELEAERQRLLLSYTDRHPDVLAIQYQINSLQGELERESTLALAGGDAADGAGPAAPVSYNPLHGQLRSRLAEVNSLVSAAESRIAASESMLARELARSARIASSESSLAELTRDYEVNRELYQDLLRRRENARVSMNLDAERRGLSFRIQEPAMKPLRGTGVRPMHVAAGGLLLGLVLPAGLLMGLLHVDPRVRTSTELERAGIAPVLVAIPSYHTARDRRRQFIRNATALAIGGAILAIYGVTWIVRHLQS